MIIVDPVSLGDVACTRASSKWVFDRSGTLIQVPADTLAVTYDPNDLTKAPYALVEPAATNLVVNSGAINLWTIVSYITPTTNAAAAPDGTVSAEYMDLTNPVDYSPFQQGYSTVAGSKYAFSIYVRAGTSKNFTIRLISGTLDAFADFDLSTGAQPVISGSMTARFAEALPNGWFRVEVTATAQGPGLTSYIYPRTQFPGGVSGGIYCWGAQFELGSKATSYIPTAGATVTRPADVIAVGAGLVYSNIAIAEPTYSATTTYAQGAPAYDPVSHVVYQSVIAGNVGKQLTDLTAWTPRGATNRWAMLDQYNNTQTTNPDEILLVLSPQAISQGLYLGNVFADEVRVSVVDQVEGLVYSETKLLVESNSGSSFFNWAFKRIRRRDYFLTLKLPAYANALVTISLRKVGGTAKCGMCAVGPVDDFGPTLAGLSTEGKDYSSTTFNFDGTSSTVIRPYAKRVTCDVMISNDQIDYLQARLFDRRQQPLVWVGGPYGSTAVYGRYGSFKNVFQYPAHSLMNLTIEGAV